MAISATTISLLSLLLAGILGSIQVIKAIQESRERRKLAQDTATKATAERDSILVQGAQGVVVMMQGALDVAKTVEGELRAELRQVKQDLHESLLREAEKDKKIMKLEYENQIFRRDLEELKRRMTKQEERGGIDDTPVI